MKRAWRASRAPNAVSIHVESALGALLEKLPFAPVYAEIVTETPQDILDKAQS